MSALQGEIEAVVRRMGRIDEVEALQRTFYLGDLEGQPAVVVGSGAGKVRAAACAQYLVDHFDIDQLIVFGMAGALDPVLEIGDIVVSRHIVMHDYFVAGEGVNEDIDLPPMRADPDLVRLAMQAGAGVVSEARTYLGTVLTGDEAVADTGRRAALHHRFGGTCVEMEGAAAAVVCSLNDTAFVIVRGISDLADGRAHQQFEQAFEAAASRATAVVVEMARLLTQRGANGRSRPALATGEHVDQRR